MDADAWLFINDEPQGRLDLSSVGFDRVRLHVTDETEGAVTRYESFTVREWDPARVDGSAPGATPTAKQEAYLRGNICPALPPNYEFVVPEGWVQHEADCTYVEYWHRSESAIFSVEVLEKPYYSRDPDTAISELIEDYESWEYFDPEDGVTSATTIASAVQTEHNGARAILLTATRTHDPPDYCKESGSILLVLPKSWEDGGQRVLEVWGQYCDHSEHLRPAVEEMVDSFRLVEPY